MTKTYGPRPLDPGLETLCHCYLIEGIPESVLERHYESIRSWRQKEQLPFWHMLTLEQKKFVSTEYAEYQRSINELGRAISRGEIP